MDFVYDLQVLGTRFRAMTVVVTFTKEYLAIEVGQSLNGKNVVAVRRRTPMQRARTACLREQGEDRRLADQHADRQCAGRIAQWTAPG